MFLRRCFLVLMGTLLTGMGISFMRISQLGTDPYVNADFKTFKNTD